MNQRKKLLARILLVLIFFNMLADCSMAVEPSNDIIYINNAEELMEFGKKCSLDTFSHGKTVKLTENINLSGSAFTSIPTFGGDFDGCGYTIEGLNLIGAGSNQGFFRYVQEIGVVRNLKVVGTIIPDGSKKNIGGIVGNNKGRILNSSFNGTVSAINSVGGIAGINEASGYIGNCKVSGTVTGENFSGGITGQNYGIVIQCTNNSYVNTSYSEEALQVQDMKIDNLKATEDVIKHTDTGGIAGYSIGILQGCKNYGKIGYQHVGYNVGGIVGRQSGYTNNCKNYGEVLGRKDVSGIVGQMEPYLIIKFSEDTLRKLENELGNLEILLDKSINDVDASSKDLSLRFSEINNLTHQASEDLHEVLNQTTNFTDETVTVINDISFRLSRMLEEMEPVISELEQASEDMTPAFQQFSDGFSELENSSSELTEGIKEIKKAFDALYYGTLSIESSIDKISRAIELLKDNLGNPKKVKQALKDIEEGINELEKTSDDIIQIVNTIAELFGELGNIGGVDWKKVRDDIITHTDSVSKNLDSGFSKIRNAISLLLDVAKEDRKTIKKSLDLLDGGLSALRDAISLMEIAGEDFQKAMIEFESATEASTRAMDKIEEGFSTLSTASEHMTSAFNELEQVVEEANNEPDIEFPMLGSKVTEPTNNLFATVDKISKEIDGLNVDSTNSSSVIVENTKAINDQVWKIINIIIEARRKALEENKDYYKDISDINSDVEDSINYENAESTSSDIRQGYVTECLNEGSIAGDVDVGGITGSMAIEYDFDPEDEIDINGKASLKFQYQTRAVLRDSINRGTVIGKKNYVGGVSGRMDLGLISGCENYGDIESTDGDYVGGISGTSSTKIRKSYAKCKLSGKDYIGGITGQGTNVSQCYTLVKILKANECIGAISGSADGEFTNNYFVKDKWDGIDNISYSGKAVPEDYNTFIQAEGLPEEFKQFSIIFKANDEVLKTLDFQYGDHLNQEDLPPIPVKEGHFSSWPEFNYDYLTFSETIEAVYTPLSTTISVADSDYSKPPQLLVEGTFGPEAKVKIESNDIVSYKPKENQKVLEEWTVTITEDKKELKETLKVRYYLPTWDKNIELWRLDDNKWHPVHTKIDGSYIVFNVKDYTTTFCIVETSTGMAHVTLLTVGLAIAIMLIVFKKRKVRKTVNLNK